MAQIEPKDKPFLSIVNLSDTYEIKARFLPSVVTLLFLLPASSAYGGPLNNWIGVLLGGVGIGAVMAVFLSHLASAAGNRLQRILWPNWPYDSPTNRWLIPSDRTISSQQKAIWYAAIKKQTGLDIPGADQEEIDTVINDAVTDLRYQFIKSEHSKRLQVHNTDYGFARNFTGFRTIWILFSVLSCIGCWSIHIKSNSPLQFCVISTTIMVFALLMAKFLPTYVRPKYSGSQAMMNKAKQMLNKSITMERTAQAFAYKGWMLFESGQESMAEAEFNKALKLDARQSMARRGLRTMKDQQEQQKKGLFKRMFK